MGPQVQAARLLRSARGARRLTATGGRLVVEYTLDLDEDAAEAVERAVSEVAHGGGQPLMR